MTIKTKTINQITFTKADLVEAIREHAIKNNLDGEYTELNNMRFTLNLDSFDTMAETDKVLTFEIPLTDRYG